MSRYFSASSALTTVCSCAASMLVLLFGAGLSVVHSQSTGCTPNPFQISSSAGSTFPAAGGTTTLTWSKPTGGSMYCPSVAATDANWIVIAAPHSPSTSGASKLTIQANNSAARSGGVTVQSNQSDATTFTISQAGTQSTSPLQVNPASISFTGVQDSGPLPSQTLAVTSTPPLNFTVSNTATFASVSPLSGTTPANLTVSATSAGLAPGTYTGTVTITPGSGGGAVQVPVSAVLTARPFAATPSALSFSYQGGAVPPSKTFAVSMLTTASDGGVFTPTVSTSSGANWLSVGAGPYNASTPVAVSVNPAGLAPGTYNGQVTLTAPSSYGIPPGVVPVTLTVGAASSLAISCFPATGPSAVRIVYISSCVASGGVAPYNWSISSGSLPAGISLSATTGSSIIVGGFPTATGSYTYTIRVADSSSQAQTQTYSGTLALGAPANLTVSPASLAFSARPDDPPGAPPPQSLSVFGSAVAGLTATVSGGNWLSVSPGSAQTPGSLTVSVNASGLAPGNTYSGQLTITGQNTTPVTFTIPVTLTLAPVLPPTVSVSPPQVQLSYAQGSGPDQRVLVVSNSGGGTLSYSVQAQTSSCGSWLTLLNPTGSATSRAPGVISFLANPSGLPSGTCSGQITVSGGPNQSQTVPVTMVVSGQSQSLLLSQTGLEFQAAAQGTIPPSQSFSIINVGAGVMNWSIDTSALPSWLNITPGIGAASPASSVAVSVSPQGLASGRYSGTVLVIAPGAGNAPKAVTVGLTVVDTGQFPPPQVTPAALILVGSSPQNLTLLNQSAVATTFTSTVFTEDGQNWLTQGPASGVIPANGTVQRAVQANPAGLSPGVQRGKLRIGFADGTVQTVEIALIVSGVAGCNPSSDLAVVFQSPEDAFKAAAQSSVTLQVVATDCSGNAPAGASGDVLIQVPGASPVPVTLTDTGNGVLTATWTPAAAVSSATLTARVYKATVGGLLFGTDSVTGDVQSASASAAPAIAVVANGASNGPPGQITPGAWMEVKGTGLADAALVGQAVPYGKTLGGAQVLLQNQPLPLYYVSQSQINALTPRVLNTDRQQLVVIRDGRRSTGVDVLVMHRQPGLFSLDGSGQGQGAILSASTAVAAGPAAPVKRGDFISIYCTGLGPVNGNPPADGAPAPLSPLYSTVTNPTVTIGGVDAPVSFSGLAPLLVGVYQINAQVPDTVAPGNAIPVKVTIGDIQSNVVTISVQ